jgi:uncharacterized protein YjbI with pentapeptide repeats
MDGVAGAVVVRSRMVHANCLRATLEFASFRDAVVVSAVLVRADLSRATIVGSDFSGADCHAPR